jgi:SAM-dependent methyltransferase
VSNDRPVVAFARLCPVCNDGPVRRWGEKSACELWRCRRCQAISCGKWTGPTDSERLYEHYHDAAHHTLAPIVEASLERVVSLAERSRLAGRWLDFGYGEGGLLEVAQRRGWACYGVEISRSMLDYGSRKGWTVTSDPRGDPRFADGTFDVVTMIEVLEHVADPVRLLSDAARWLRPGGLLYVTTPNAGGLNCRILGQAWSVVCPPQHLILWTPRALRVALARAGFSTWRLRAEGFNPVEILAWMRGGRLAAERVNRYESGLALSAALERSRVRRIAKAVVNRGLSALGLGDTLKVWASRAA